MTSVHHLPTAAPRKVRQEVKPGPGRRRALEAGQAAGKIHRLPLSHYVAPQERERRAADEAERELFSAGGVNRSAAWILAHAMFAALEPDQRDHTVATLRLLATLTRDPGPMAALAAVGPCSMAPEASSEGGAA